MSRLIERLPILRVEFREHHAMLRERAANRPLEAKGAYLGSLASNVRFLGVADYLLDGNIKLFQSRLSESAALQVETFERYDRGEPIDDSYVAMLSYKELYDALAAGDEKTARRLAGLMGGRDEIESQHDHPFGYAMGYTLKAFVERDRPACEEWAARFRNACGVTNSQDFLGYADVFDAILAEDAALADAGLERIVKGHKKQSKGSGVFVCTDDEVLCVWGVGLARLAKSYGLDVSPRPPLIPKDLIE